MKREYNIISKADGLEISVLEVLPESNPKAIVQLVHGMSEHKERYIPFMEYLADQGYACIIHDHRGHGKSVKNKADLGYMNGGGAEALIEDIHSINHHIRMEFPGCPLVLLGHSMGSLAVRAFAAIHDDHMDQLIISGSPSNNPARAFGEMLAKIEGKIRGERHRSKILDQLSFGSYMKKFKGEEESFGWLSSDIDVVRQYTESEYCGFVFTDEAFGVLFELMKRAYDVKNWKCTAKNLPVLFISGAMDPCMGNIREFAKAVKAMRRAGYLNVRGKVYPDMRHEVLNEIGKEQVYKDICSYIKKNLNC